MRRTEAFAFGVALLGLAGLASAQNETHVTGEGSHSAGQRQGTIQSVLYDNGPPNGLNGYSNATAIPFGARRTLLDDFRIGDREGWRITDFHWEHIWNSLPPGSGTGMELLFRHDNGGTPGAVAAVANITSYMEQATGNVYFGRPGAVSWVDFDPIDLGPGTYWFEATIVGPENNFWLTANQNGNECWVNYDDFGGLQPGQNIFGVTSDINFIITGEIIPVPGTLALLAAGADARDREDGQAGPAGSGSRSPIAP
jgi:hypothetical protein